MQPIDASLAKRKSVSVNDLRRKELAMRDKFIDPRDGNTYNIVLLRDRNWWLAENLDIKRRGSFPADKEPDERISQ